MTPAETIAVDEPAGEEDKRMRRSDRSSKRTCASVVDEGEPAGRRERRRPIAAKGGGRRQLAADCQNIGKSFVEVAHHRPHELCSAKYT